MRLSVLGGRRSEASRSSQIGAETPASQPVATSALCVEVGGVATRAALVDSVDGRHRLVASGVSQTTLATTGDMVLGLRNAVAEVERIAHRRLVDNGGIVSPEHHDGSGVDAVVLTSGQPLRVALLPLETGLPLAEVRAALRGCSVLTVDCLDPGELARPGISVLERLLAMLERRPQVVLVLARALVEDGARLGQIGQSLTEALGRRASSSPAVLFVGAPSLAGQLETLLNDEVSVRTIDPTGPGSLSVAVPREMRAIWRDRLVRESRGYDVAETWASCPIVPTAEAFATALRFLARRRACWVCGVDVGASTSCLVRANAEKSVVHLAEIGVTRKLDWALADDAFRQLLPGVEPDALRDALWNRALRPWAVPETPEEQSISRALTREAICALRRATTADACRWEREIGLVVARGGGLSLANQPAESAWAIAEGLAAVGVLELAVDQHEMLPGLGALAGVAPHSAADALLADGLTNLATLALGEGGVHHGGTACRATLRCLDGRTQQTDVLVGQVVALSLATSEVGDLTLAPAEGIDFGWGVGQTVNLRVRGGAAGLLVGARVASGVPTMRLGGIGGRLGRLRSGLKGASGEG